MFASRSLAVHLARGGVGLGALAAAVSVAQAHPLISLALMPVGLVALRGCPMCWTMGLIETAAATLKGERNIARGDSCMTSRSSLAQCASREH